MWPFDRLGALLLHCERVPVGTALDCRELIN